MNWDGGLLLTVLDSVFWFPCAIRIRHRYLNFWALRFPWCACEGCRVNHAILHPTFFIWSGGLAGGSSGFLNPLSLVSFASSLCLFLLGT